MVLAGFLAGCLGGCAHPAPVKTTSAPAAAKADANLYSRLGGKPAIEAVIEDFLHNVALDSRINARFAMTDIGDLQHKLVDQVCEATGGPCHYTGRSMAASHKHMGVTQAEFTALVEDLVKTLDTLKVLAREKNELLGALESMQPDIVASP